MYGTFQPVPAALLVFTLIQKADPQSERADFHMGGPGGYGSGWDLDKRSECGPGVEQLNGTAQSGDKWCPAPAK